MKRGSEGGSSPLPKSLYMADTDSSQELYFDNSSQQTVSNSSQPVQLTGITASSYSSFSLPDISFPSSPPTFLTSSSDDSYDGSETEAGKQIYYWQNTPSPKSSIEDFPNIEVEANCQNTLDDLVNSVGAAKAATAILDNVDLREEITKLLFFRSCTSLKETLKKSKLAAKKRDRNYLLTLTPKVLCEEFRDLAHPAFELLVRGLLGLSNPEDVFDSHHLLNTVSLVYSTVAKTINRKATGYALLLTSVARDGGLREDSIRVLSACLVHPRTSQKFDKSVLSVGWDSNLVESLREERVHFEELKKVEAKIEELLQEYSTNEAVEVARDDLERLLDTAPPQLQMVWDNLNLRSDHRFHRVGDSYSDSNLDWMASMWIKDRIDANHMMHGGVALKRPENLSIKDFVTSDKEREYVFMALVSFFSSRLVERHPILFKSIANHIKESRPHQFQEAMNKKSEEFTGNLFTLSETSTEDLIKMMQEVQLNVHTYKDDGGQECCHERKIVSGDNKTEKNMHYAILRLTMQKEG